MNNKYYYLFMIINNLNFSNNHLSVLIFFFNFHLNDELLIFNLYKIFLYLNNNQKYLKLTIFKFKNYFFKNNIFLFIIFS